MRALKLKAAATLHDLGATVDEDHLFRQSGIVFGFFLAIAAVGGCLVLVWVQPYF
jgi:hypothetical protein